MSVGTMPFRRLPPTPWNGRYARIPGETSVFHLEFVRGRLWPVIKWQLDVDRGRCVAMRTSAAAEMTEAVIEAKRFCGSSGGGAFQINEFGQVLVPASDLDDRRILAGELLGPLRFENPFAPHQPIDLEGDAYLQSGDPWKLPYVGMPFVFYEGSIYFKHSEGGIRRRQYPPRQDDELIRALRRLRPSGCRILVTHRGAVLTKVAAGNRRGADDSYQPIYVGSIDLNRWFHKE